MTTPTPSPRRGGVRAFATEVAAEVGKVTWPTGPQTVRYTAVVLAFLLVMVSLVAFTDAGLATVAMRVFG